MQKILGITLLVLCFFTACNNTDTYRQNPVTVESADVIAETVTEEIVEEAFAVEESVEEDPLIQVEKLLQGTWEYYDSSIGFGEILKFDHGIVDYNSYLDAARDKDSHSQGTYQIIGSNIITTINEHDTSFDYEIVENQLSITYHIDSGYDANTVRIYYQTDTIESDTTKVSSNSTDAEINISTPNLDETSPTEDISMLEENALKKAKSYLDLMPFSYSGLIEQLEYEGFTHSEAVYGADNCGADWYEQAVKKAADYLDLMAFSRSGLIEQLEYEGYTHEQAVYGVEQNGY